MTERAFYAFKQVDMLGQPLTLRLNGSSTVKTEMGAVLSICYLASVLTVAVLSCKDFIVKTNPMVLQYETQLGEHPRIDLTPENNMFPILYAIKGATKVISIVDIYKYVTPLAYKRKTYLSNINGTVKVVNEDIYIPLVPCSDLLKDKEKYKFYKQYESSSTFTSIGLKGYGLCMALNESETYLKGSLLESTRDSIHFKILPCSLPSGCEPESSISKVSLGLGDFTSSFNFANYENPVSKTQDVDKRFYLHKANQRQVIYQMAFSELKDTSQAFFSSSKSTSFLYIRKVIEYLQSRNENQVNCTADMIASNTCEAYLEMSYWSSDHRHLSVRSYKSIYQTFSEIGGFSSLGYYCLYYLLLIARRHTPRNSIYSLIFGKTLECENQSRSENQVSAVKELNVCSEKKSWTSLKKNGEALIESMLDISNLISELCILKSIANIFLKGRHQKVGPYLALSNNCKEAEKKTLSQAIYSERSNCKDDIISILSQKDLGSDSMDFQSNFTNLLDNYCIENLGNELEGGLQMIGSRPFTHDLSSPAYTSYNPIRNLSPNSIKKSRFFVKKLRNERVGGPQKFDPDAKSDKRQDVVPQISLDDSKADTTKRILRESSDRSLMMSKLGLEKVSQRKEVVKFGF